MAADTSKKRKTGKSRATHPRSQPEVLLIQTKGKGKDAHVELFVAPEPKKKEPPW